MRIWGLYVSWCRAVVESEQLLKLGSSFERPDHFWSAVEIIMRTTLIADDKSQSQRRIWLVQSCQGSSWRNKAAFCFGSKAFCLRFKEKKKLTLILHQNWSVIRSQIKPKKNYLRMCRICTFALYVKTENAKPCSGTLWSSEASLCFEGPQWSDSHAAFVMAKYAALKDCIQSRIDLPFFCRDQLSHSSISQRETAAIEGYHGGQPRPNLSSFQWSLLIIWDLFKFWSVICWTRLVQRNHLPQLDSHIGANEVIPKVQTPSIWPLNQDKAKVG